MLSKNFFELFQELTNLFATWAKDLKVKANAMFILGIVLAVVVGIVGYHLIKLLMGVALGTVGYFAGTALFTYLRESFEVFEKVPDWVSYVFGGVVALLLMILGFARFRYAVFVAYAAIGYYLVYYYISEELVMTLAGALIFALIASICVRFFSILLTSAIGGFAGVSFLGAILPKVSALQIGTTFDVKNVAFWIAVGASLLFVIVQYLTRTRKDPIYG